MATEITMPKLSDTMTEGRLISWKKGVGERIERGEIIAEVETDKANMELEAFASGILLETRVKAGEVVAVGTVIGIIGAPGETSAAAPEAAAPTAAQPAAEPPRRIVEETAAPPPRAAPAAAAAPEERAAPVVRRRARELGIDLSQVQGSGPAGRVLLDDLERFRRIAVAAGGGEPLPQEEEALPPPGETSAPAVTAAEGVPLSRMRAAIARTVEQAWHTIPHFYVTVELFMDAAEEVRRELKGSGAAVSVNDLVVKGAALALGRFPRVNASFAGDRIVEHGEINIGIAVALADGLLVPVLRGCEGLSLKEIAGKSRLLVERARSGQLSQAELSGGTFSVSNLGMYGVSDFAAVIHPPQAAILAVGAVRETVVVKGGQPDVAQTMRVTLSADHRVLDGAYAAQFLAELKKILESPVTMLV